jgi:hypothetical protein
MTPIRIPLHSKPMHYNPLQQTFTQVEMTSEFDPTIEGEKEAMHRGMLFDSERDTTPLDHAACFWAGIHWYRELHD